MLHRANPWRIQQDLEQQQQSKPNEQLPPIWIALYPRSPSWFSWSPCIDSENRGFHSPREGSLLPASHPFLGLLWTGDGSQSGIFQSFCSHSPKQQGWHLNGSLFSCSLPGPACICLPTASSRANLPQAGRALACSCPKVWLLARDQPTGRPGNSSWPQVSKPTLK